MTANVKYWVQRRLDGEMRLAQMQAEGAGDTLAAKQLELALAWDALVHPFRIRLLNAAEWVIRKARRG